jgi:hypothetical protein
MKRKERIAMNEKTTLTNHIPVHLWLKNKTEHFGTKTPGGSKMDPWKSTTYNNQNGTTVPFRKETYDQHPRS